MRLGFLCAVAVGVGLPVGEGFSMGPLAGLRAGVRTGTSASRAVSRSPSMVYTPPRVGEESLESIEMLKAKLNRFVEMPSANHHSEWPIDVAERAPVSPLPCPCCGWHQPCSIPVHWSATTFIAV